MKTVRDMLQEEKSGRNKKKSTVSMYLVNGKTLIAELGADL